jgi:hypothetical protein
MKLRVEVVKSRLHVSGRQAKRQSFYHYQRRERALRKWLRQLAGNHLTHADRINRLAAARELGWLYYSIERTA